MNKNKAGLITITLVRNPREERALEKSLAQLSRCELPVIAADGGSSIRFVGALDRLGISISRPVTNGLVAQVKAAIRSALKAWPGNFLLYTEPDKYPFFGQPLLNFIAEAKPNRRFGVAMASRTPRSFKTFPKGQQWTESFMNEAAHLLFANKNKHIPDYCYGPLLLSPRAAELILDCPDHLGWGWRFYAIGRAKAQRLEISSVVDDLPCPKEQRSEDSPGDRQYRLKQLRQNLSALELVAEKKNPPSSSRAG